MFVEFAGRCVGVSTLVSGRDLPPRTVLDSFDVMSSGMDGAVRVLVDVVALIWAPPVLTATPAESDVVFELVDIAAVDVAVEAAAGVVDDVEDAAGPAMDELDDDVESEGDELDGSAPAIP